MLKIIKYSFKNKQINFYKVLFDDKTNVFTMLTQTWSFVMFGNM